jgi:type IV secretion system protein VirD4
MYKKVTRTQIYLLGCVFLLCLYVGFVLAGALIFLRSGAFSLQTFGQMQFKWNIWWIYYSIYGGIPYFGSILWGSLALGCVLPFFGFIALVIKVYRSERALYGEARFATKWEVFKSKDTPFNAHGDGIMVGKLGRYLYLGGSQFAMLCAPTRSGKGVGVVVPNGLTYRHSMVVLDIKGELFEITSKYRQNCGQEVFMWNPFTENKRSHRYNPLGYIRDGHDRVGDVDSIAKVFYPAEGKDSFFENQAANLFSGLVLYLCETPELPRTVGEVLRQSSGYGEPFEKYMTAIINNRAAGKIKDSKGNVMSPLSDVCKRKLLQYINGNDTTRASILLTFNSVLGHWDNPIVDAATSAGTAGLVGDFDLRKVREKHMSIYVSTTPNKLELVSRLFNLFFAQLINQNMNGQLGSAPHIKHPCLIMLDEFSSIGYVAIIHKAASYIAGYGLRLLTIIQAPSQLREPVPIGYGNDGAETLNTNHACRILYTPKEIAHAKEYSDMLGNITAISRSRSRSQPKSAGGSASESAASRPLLYPQEVMEIPVTDEIIRMENMKPIYCQKVRYYKDPNFMRLLMNTSVSMKAVYNSANKTHRIKRLFGLLLIGKDMAKAFKQALLHAELSSDVPELEINYVIPEPLKPLKSPLEILRDQTKGNENKELLKGLLPDAAIETGLNLKELGGGDVIVGIAMEAIVDGAKIAVVKNHYDIRIEPQDDNDGACFGFDIPEGSEDEQEGDILDDDEYHHDDCMADDAAPDRIDQDENNAENEGLSVDIVQSSETQAEQIKLDGLRALTQSKILLKKKSKFKGPQL